MESMEHTRMFAAVDTNEVNISETLRLVHSALMEKGYSPLDQIVGYLVSGDPSYITSHNGARENIQRIERDDLLEEIVAYYLSSLMEQRG